MRGLSFLYCCIVHRFDLMVDTFVVVLSFIFSSLFLFCGSCSEDCWQKSMMEEELDLNLLNLFYFLFFLFIPSPLPLHLLFL